MYITIGNMFQQIQRVKTNSKDTGIETEYFTHAGMFLLSCQSLRITRVKTGSRRRRKNNCTQKTYVVVSGFKERKPIINVTAMTP
jgi:hypothetical protein